MGRNQGWGSGVGAWCFWLLGAGADAASKKTEAGTRAGAAWKKNQEPEPLKISRLLSPTGK